MRKYLVIFYGTLALISAKSNAQVINEVQNSFNLYRQSTVQEKIFVHTDKTVYLPGEIVWFKVYCVDGNDNKPLNLSKVVYVDVLDNNQNAVIQAKIPVKYGFGSGSLYIPVTVNNGNYKFRAYTSWMKNFSPDLYFEKVITLVNPLKSPETSIKQGKEVYDVRFFPEGGSLLAGVESKVAFKAVAQNGKGVSLTGAILNQQNDTVVRFRSLKFGMGSFQFTPAANSSYHAVVSIGKEQLTKEIPPVALQGYAMKVTDDGSGILNVTIKSEGSTSDKLYLFAHTRQDVKAAATATLSGGTSHFTLSKAALGDGISHITIFDSRKQPVCERLYFKRPNQQLFIAASADQALYGVRKRVIVNIAAKNAGGMDATANMSMAVYKVDSLQRADKINIFNYLWLGADLKGTVESPDDYFIKTGAEAEQAADNLMLTQGWTRFQWHDLLENNAAEFTYLPEYYGHIVSAKIVNTQTGEQAKNTLTYLAIPGKRVQLYTAKSDSLGRLQYFTKDFYGANELIAQTNQLVDSTYRIDILSPFSEQNSKTSLPRFAFNDSMIPALREHSLGIQVLNIYTGNNLKRFYEPQIDSSAFYGKPSVTYKLDDFTRFTTMEEDLREYVKEDNIVRTKGKFHIKVLTNRGFLDGGDPLVLLDGVPMFNIDKIFTVDPLKVRKLEVVATPYYYGPTEQEGIFSFTTYKGDFGGVELDPRAVVIDYEGLQLNREFYSPIYDTAEQAASRIPDFRNVLNWTPEIISTGKNVVSFYTSDQPGKYVGVVQGITANGNAGSQYFNFEVK